MLLYSSYCPSGKKLICLSMHRPPLCQQAVYVRRATCLKPCLCEHIRTNTDLTLKAVPHKTLMVLTHLYISSKTS